MEEVMTGTHKIVGQHEERFMEFRIKWGSNNILECFNPLHENFLLQELYGDIIIDGICGATPCYGTLHLNYPKGYLEYQIFFNYLGKDYFYKGTKKNLRPWNLHKTHTTCYGTLYRKNHQGSRFLWDIVSDSVVYFRLNTLLTFLKSFRLMRGNNG